MTNLEQALRGADEALQAYENHRSPFADDWAMLALELRRALEELRDAVQPEYEYAIKANHGFIPTYTEGEARARIELDLRYRTGHVVRRTKAGIWEEVE